MILSETWFMEGYIDFELQKYRLLAYLKDVKDSFHETRLYPQLADIVFHYNNLVAFRNNKQLLQNQFPRRLDAVNMQKMELVYEQLLADSELMQELEHITNYAIGQMKTTIAEGAEIYDIVEQKLVIEPVGIMPIYNSEGYVFLHCGNYPEVRIYNYNITLFEHQHSRYRGIKMDYVDSRNKNLVNTYEQIKVDIVRTYRTLPNPAVFRVECPLVVPLNETLLPVTKRILARQIDKV